MNNVVIPPMKQRLLIAALIGLYAALLLPLSAQTGPNDSVGPMAKVTLHIGKASLTTTIAVTHAQQERGLMYVTQMPDNAGMIFLLPKIQTATFWMKNTLIPLSVAFIDKDGVILEIHDMQRQRQSRLRPRNQSPLVRPQRRQTRRQARSRARHARASRTLRKETLSTEKHESMNT